MLGGGFALLCGDSLGRQCAETPEAMFPNLLISTISEEAIRTFASSTVLVLSPVSGLTGGYPKESLWILPCVEPRRTGGSSLEETGTSRSGLIGNFALTRDEVSILLKFGETF